MACDHRVLSTMRGPWSEWLHDALHLNDTWLSLPSEELITRPVNDTCLQRGTTWRSECLCLEFEENVWNWVWSVPRDSWQRVDFCCDCIAACLQERL